MLTPAQDGMHRNILQANDFSSSASFFISCVLHGSPLYPRDTTMMKRAAEQAMGVVCETAAVGELYGCECVLHS